MLTACAERLWILKQRKLQFSTFAALAAGAVIVAAPAHASLIADGITYTLTATTLTATTDQFTLGISGINGPSDTERGRYGVQSFAFSPPSNLSSAVAPSGFTYKTGGLNSSGCTSHGNFFCFSANTPPTGPALSANSTLSFVFDLTISSGSFARYDPSFKIDWVGKKNKYDLVSLPLAPTLGVPVSEPATLALLATGLLGIAWLGWGARKRVTQFPSDNTEAASGNPNDATGEVFGHAISEGGGSP